MLELSVVSIFWAISFSLIGLYITPFVDPYLAVLIRIICGLIIYLPFIKYSSIKNIRDIMIVGACQFGMTYILLYQSYHYLTVIEILVFSITTPIYIVLINSLFNRKIELKAFIAGFLAVIGAGIIRYQQISNDYLIGFLLMQGANFVFAFGQTYYQRTQKKSSKNYQNFFWFFLGAFAIALPSWLILGKFRFDGDESTILSLLYVGIIVTALGQYFWLQGATKVSNATLSVMNNLLIPLGIVINFAFGGKINAPCQFTIGTSIILLSLWVARVKPLSKIKIA